MFLTPMLKDKADANPAAVWIFVMQFSLRIFINVIKCLFVVAKCASRMVFPSWVSEWMYSEMNIFLYILMFNRCIPSIRYGFWYWFALSLWIIKLLMNVSCSWITTTVHSINEMTTRPSCLLLPASISLHSDYLHHRLTSERKQEYQYKFLVSFIVYLPYFRYGLLIMV